MEATADDHVSKMVVIFSGNEAPLSSLFSLSYTKGMEEVWRGMGWIKHQSADGSSRVRAGD